MLQNMRAVKIGAKDKDLKRYLETCKKYYLQPSGQNRRKGSL